VPMAHHGEWSGHPAVRNASNRSAFGAGLRPRRCVDRRSPESVSNSSIVRSNGETFGHVYGRVRDPRRTWSHEGYLRILLETRVVYYFGNLITEVNSLCDGSNGGQCMC
jgi:hypothetical protein